MASEMLLMLLLTGVNVGLVFAARHIYKTIIGMLEVDADG